jgi:hypothetical protein
MRAKNRLNTVSGAKAKLVNARSSVEKITTSQ